MAAGIPLVPTQPADPYASAVQAANRDYPRLAQYNMRLTYDPKVQFWSETYPPKEEGNPFPGNWTVSMGNNKYYRDPSSWPGLVALEGLHALQTEDPRYQAMSKQLGTMLTPQQQAMVQKFYQQNLARDPQDKRTLEQFTQQVQIPEIIRSRLFNPLFHKMENVPLGADEYGLTPEQKKLIDQIDQYMRTTGP